MDGTLKRFEIGVSTKDIFAYKNAFSKISSKKIMLFRNFLINLTFFLEISTNNMQFYRPKSTFRVAHLLFRKAQNELELPVKLIHGLIHC